MKLSKSTVKKVWMHWMKHQETIAIKKFGGNAKDNYMWVGSFKPPQLGILTPPLTKYI